MAKVMEAKEVEVLDFCNSLIVELSTWKAKMYDLVKKLDRTSTGAKEKVVNEVNELHMIIEELGDRIEKLRRECPVSWGPDRTEIENKMGYMGRKMQGILDTISNSDIGG